MRVRGPGYRARRGITAAECGIVYSVTLLLIMGTIIEGLGVFRYQQVSSLAREGARWASVRGATYQSEQSASAPTSSDVLNNVITPKAVGLDPSNLTCTLTMTATTATVTLTYQWTPEAFGFSAVPLTSTSVMPITY
jgi:hypothetical protein